LNVDVNTANTPAFQSTLREQTASALGVNVSRVAIGEVRAGSAVISIIILPDPSASATAGAATSNTAGTAPLAPTALASTLIAQVANPTSVFAAAVSTSLNVAVDTTYSSTLLIQCSDGSYQAVCPTAAPTLAPTAAPPPTPQPTTAAPPPDALEPSYVRNFFYIAAGALTGVVIVGALFYKFCRSSSSIAPSQELTVLGHQGGPKLYALGAPPTITRTLTTRQSAQLAMMNQQQQQQPGGLARSLSIIRPGTLQQGPRPAPS
jgi:hypothetical protein